MADFITPIDIVLDYGYYQPTHEADLWVGAEIGLLCLVLWFLQWSKGLSTARSFTSSIVTAATGTAVTKSVAIVWDVAYAAITYAITTIESVVNYATRGCSSDAAATKRGSNSSIDGTILRIVIDIIVWPCCTVAQRCTARHLRHS